MVEPSSVPSQFFYYKHHLLAPSIIFSYEQYIGIYAFLLLRGSKGETSAPKEALGQLFLQVSHCCHNLNILQTVKLSLHSHCHSHPATAKHLKHFLLKTEK